MRVTAGSAEPLSSPPHPSGLRPATFPPVGGRLWVRSNREEFGPLWDVWIHILGIGAKCACWKAGGHMGPPLRCTRRPPLLFRRGRTLAGPWFRATIRAAPTREGAGTCPLIRPSGRPAADGPKYGQIFYYVTFCDILSKNSTKAAENINFFKNRMRAPWNFSPFTDKIFVEFCFVKEEKS